MTTDNSRADALTDDQIEGVLTDAGIDFYSQGNVSGAIKDLLNGVRACILLAASPVEQHEAAPDGSEPPDGDKEHWHRLYLQERKARQRWQALAMPEAASADSIDDLRDKWKLVDGDCREGANGLITYHVDAFNEGLRAVSQPEPRAADERAAFAEWWKSIAPSSFDYTSALAGYLARASSPNAAGAEEPTIPAELHHDTAKLVRRFARALANKLLSAQRKYGYSDNWMRDGWADECRAELMRHIHKGDPRDVAAYCAFLWHHNESTACEPVGIAGDAIRSLRVIADEHINEPKLAMQLLAIANALSAAPPPPAPASAPVGLTEERAAIKSLDEPVTVEKALLAGRIARAEVEQGGKSAAFLVNIQLTGWRDSEEYAEAFSRGFNSAAAAMQRAILEGDKHV